MSQSIKVGAYQALDIQNDIPTALKHIQRASESTPDAALICFPECFLQGYATNAVEAHKRAIDLDSKEFATVLEHLRGCGSTLVIGLIEQRNNQLYNSAVVIHRGELKGVYRKTHLLKREAAFSSGRHYPVFSLNGGTFGINICYDARHETAAQPLADAGAQIICFPLNNTLPKATAEHWKECHADILSTRAKQTHAWVVSADVVHDSEDTIGYGCTAIINPAGVIVKQQQYSTVGLITAVIRVSGPQCRPAQSAKDGGRCGNSAGLRF